MYFVGDIDKNGRIGIVDTKDGKIEYFTEDFIKKNLSQVFIVGLDMIKLFVSRGYINIEELIGIDETEKLNFKLFKCMYKLTNKRDINEFLSNYYYQLCCTDSEVSIPSDSSCCKVFNYTEVTDKAIIIYSNNGSCCISASNNLGCFNKKVFSNCRLSKLYPCGSGRLYNTYFRHDFGIELGLNDNVFYTKLVSDDSVIFVRVTNYGYNGIDVVCEKKITDMYE